MGVRGHISLRDPILYITSILSQAEFQEIAKFPETASGPRCPYELHHRVPPHTLLVSTQLGLKPHGCFAGWKHTAYAPLDIPSLGLTSPGLWGFFVCLFALKGCPILPFTDTVWVPNPAVSLMCQLFE